MTKTDTTFYISGGAKEAICDRFECDRSQISFDLDAGDDGKLFVAIAIYRNFSMEAGYEVEAHKLDLAAFAEYMNVEID